jgi:hypothetical protein
MSVGSMSLTEYRRDLRLIDRRNLYNAFQPIFSPLALPPSTPSLDNAEHCAHDECPERVNLELVHRMQTKVVRAANYLPQIIL